MRPQRVVAPPAEDAVDPRAAGIDPPNRVIARRAERLELHAGQIDRAAVPEGQRLDGAVVEKLAGDLDLTTGPAVDLQLQHRVAQPHQADVGGRNARTEADLIGSPAQIVDAVRAIAPGEDVSVIAGDVAEAVITAPAVQQVIALIAVQFVAAAPAQQLVGAAPTEQRVLAIAAVEEVGVEFDGVHGLRPQRVVAPPAEDAVDPRAAGIDPPNRVIARRAERLELHAGQIDRAAIPEGQRLDGAVVEKLAGDLDLAVFATIDMQFQRCVQETLKLKIGGLYAFAEDDAVCRAAEILDRIRSVALVEMVAVVAGDVAK